MPLTRGIRGGGGAGGICESVNMHSPMYARPGGWTAVVGPQAPATPASPWALRAQADATQPHPIMPLFFRVGSQRPAILLPGCPTALTVRCRGGWVLDYTAVLKATPKAGRSL